jgi:hypothetical protein
MIRAVPARDVRRALLEKGFGPPPEGSRHRDHEFFFFYLDGKKTNALVKLSRGAIELRRDEIRMNARRLNLTGDHLFRIVSCEHDREKTRELLEAQLQG